MNFIRVIGKYILYMLLYLCIFTTITLISMFVTNSFNVFEWWIYAKLMLLYFSWFITFLIFLVNED